MLTTEPNYSHGEKQSGPEHPTRNRQHMAATINTAGTSVYEFMLYVPHVSCMLLNEAERIYNWE